MSFQKKILVAAIVAVLILAAGFSIRNIFLARVSNGMGDGTRSDSLRTTPPSKDTNANHMSPGADSQNGITTDLSSVVDRCFLFNDLVPTKEISKYRQALETSNYPQAFTQPLNLTINDEQEYKKLFVNHERQSCANEDPSTLIPEVDFSKETVLGQYMFGACFDTGFERKVTRNDALKQVIYTVHTIGVVSSCMEEGPQSLNLIAVPKIPPDYRVNFVLEGQ